MRRDARVDTNQIEIAKAFRRAGWKVLHLHAIGQGVPDLLVARYGSMKLVEIKDGAKSPSRKKLNERQEKFHEDWASYVEVVYSVDDVVQLTLESGEWCDNQAI